MRFKVWQKLPQFKPNHDRPYGNFFAWVRVLSRHIFFDRLRKREVQFVDEESPEALSIADPKADMEQSLLYKEVMAEFEKSIYALPPNWLFDYLPYGSLNL